MSEQVQAVFDDLPDKLVQNAWTKTGHARFDWCTEDNVVKDKIGDNNFVADDNEEDLVLQMTWPISTDKSNGQECSV